MNLEQERKLKEGKGKQKFQFLAIRNSELPVA